MTGDNNGNVYSQALDAPGLPATLTQTYNYDGVNRLGGVTETGGATNWSRTFAYDDYGNRAANGAEVFVDTPQSTANDFNAATNRLETAWAVYDLAGNLTIRRVRARAMLRQRTSSDTSCGPFFTQIGGRLMRRRRSWKRRSPRRGLKGGVPLNPVPRLRFS